MAGVEPWATAEWGNRGGWHNEKQRNALALSCLRFWDGGADGAAHCFAARPGKGRFCARNSGFGDFLNGRLNRQERAKK